MNAVLEFDSMTRTPRRPCSATKSRLGGPTCSTPAVAPPTLEPLAVDLVEAGSRWKWYRAIGL